MDFSKSIIQIFVSGPVLIIDSQFIDDIFSHNNTSGAHCFFLRGDAVKNAIDLAAISLFFADCLNDTLAVFFHQIGTIPVQQVDDQVLGNVSGSLCCKGKDDIQFIAAGQHQTKFFGVITKAELNAFKGHTQFFHRQITDCLHNLSVIRLFRKAQISHCNLISSIGSSVAIGGSSGIGAGRFSTGGAVGAALSGGIATAGSESKCTQRSCEDSCENSFFHNVTS